MQKDDKNKTSGQRLLTKGRIAVTAANGFARLRLHLIHGSLGLPETRLPSNRHLDWFSCFLQGSPLYPIDRHTDRQTTLRVTSVVMGRIYPTHAVWPTNCKRCPKMLTYYAITCI